MKKEIINGNVEFIGTGSNEYYGESYINVGGNILFLDLGRYTPPHVRSALLNFDIISQYIAVFTVFKEGRNIIVGFDFTT